jgi:hypothetical protein
VYQPFSAEEIAQKIYEAHQRSNLLPLPLWKYLTQEYKDRHAAIIQSLIDDAVIIPGSEKNRGTVHCYRDGEERTRCCGKTISELDAEEGTYLVNPNMSTCQTSGPAVWI